MNEIAQEEWKQFPDAKGFTIGNGKKLYWYHTVSPKGFYYAYPVDENGLLGWRRQVNPNDSTTVIYGRDKGKRELE